MTAASVLMLAPRIHLCRAQLSFDTIGTINHAPKSKMTKYIGTPTCVDLSIHIAITSTTSTTVATTVAMRLGINPMQILTP